jgi:beta-glucosidase
MNKFLKFPEGFLWGAASASYQVEGGIYNNDWAKAAIDTGKVPPADSACDHYNKYEQDFDIAKSLGQNCQRISIEWSRIEPEDGIFNQDEIAHYRKVLQSMNDRGLKSFVTLWHFTIPAWFSEEGGFEQKDAPEKFARYCNFVVGQLNDLCQNFSTINEPLVITGIGYHRGEWPPFKKSKIKAFKVVNQLIRSHNLAYKEIKRENENINVGIVKHNICFVSNWNPWNKIKAAFADYACNCYFLNRTMKNSDSIGINYYTCRFFGVKNDVPKSDMGWPLNPEGLAKVLVGVKKYNKPVYVTEAGIADEKDQYRSEYIKGLVKSVHEAIESGVDVRGFMYWSILDNFEWAEGFWPRFGLVEIDYKSPDKTRTIRKSAYTYKTVCENNGLKIE